MESSNMHDMIKGLQEVQRGLNDMSKGLESLKKEVMQKVNPEEAERVLNEIKSLDLERLQKDALSKIEETKKRYAGIS